MLLEHIEGEYIETPCADKSLLSIVVSFQDEFKEIGFPSDLSPRLMDETETHEYRLEQLKYILGTGSLCDNVDSIYESFLCDINYATIPFDRILHNTLRTETGLRFFDFKWTIFEPYEFTLARIAVEFNSYNTREIWTRIES